MSCKHPDHNHYPIYGLAPHKHVGLTKNPASVIGSTQIIEKSEWPDDFIETEPGMGIWVCPHCCKKSVTNEPEGE